MGKKLIVAIAVGLAVSAVVGLPGALRAQEAQDADEIARQLSNPVGSLASLVLQGNYAQLDGSLPGVGDQSSTSLIFMPTLPFKLGSGNLIVRPSFPVVGVPTLDENGAWSKSREFGDIVLLANWGRMEKSGIIWSIGGTFVFPTASGDVGNDQWQAGPGRHLSRRRFRGSTS